MTYDDFKYSMAGRGFLGPILSESTFSRLARKGLTSCQIESVAMDMNAGFSISESLRASEGVAV